MGYLLVAILCLVAGLVTGWLVRRRVYVWCAVCLTAVGPLCIDCRDRQRAHNLTMASQSESSRGQS
jgi:hypothetical protein